MKRSLEDRLAPLPESPTENAIQGETLEEFFRGVGLLTGLAYPAQRLEQIYGQYRFSENYRYKRAILFARRDLGSTDWREDGEKLMTQLLIEPFAAIHEILKEDEDHGSV